MILSDDTEVWPGHDYGVAPSSTIANERETNPFLLRETFEDFVDLKRNWAAYKAEHGVK
jgi:glyoxylase-like metal-dependent hydrolase (beta-lactamase superfamily II)